MAKHPVLRPFNFSFDGITVKEVRPGEEHDFGVCTQGLLDDKWIGKVGSIIPAVVVSIDATAADSKAVTTAIERQVEPGIVLLGEPTQLNAASETVEAAAAPAPKAVAAPAAPAPTPAPRNSRNRR